MTTIQATTIYRGKRGIGDGPLRVTIDTPGAIEADDGESMTLRKSLPARTDLFNHSPTGFECGYEGSGPAQLALAITVDHLERHALRTESAAITLGEPLETETSRPLHERIALRLYQDFKRAIVAKLPRTRAWEISDDDVGKALDIIVARRQKGAA